MWNNDRMTEGEICFATLYILPVMVSVSQSPVLVPSLYVSAEVVAVKVEGPEMTIDS